MCDSGAAAMDKEWFWQGLERLRDEWGMNKDDLRTFMWHEQGRPAHLHVQQWRWQGKQSGARATSTSRSSPTQYGHLQRWASRTRRCSRRWQGKQRGAQVTSTSRASPTRHGRLRQLASRTRRCSRRWRMKQSGAQATSTSSTSPTRHERLRRWATRMKSCVGP